MQRCFLLLPPLLLVRIPPAAPSLAETSPPESPALACKDDGPAVVLAAFFLDFLPIVGQILIGELTFETLSLHNSFIDFRDFIHFIILAFISLVDLGTSVCRSVHHQAMGKKSKKNAAKPKGSASSASGEVGGGGIQGETSLAAIATSGSNKKKLKCVRCFGNIKDTTKAHACPGCSLLCCWRCEKKCFFGCPNDASCATPMRRCWNCIESKTLQSSLNKAGHHFRAEQLSAPNARREIYHKITDVQQKGELTC